MKFPNGHFHQILNHDQCIETILAKNEQLNELPTIPEFFADKEIFITGGSGFIGKVLVEKLLRSCPDIKVIYFLLRPKKGQSAIERLKSICDEIVFDALRIINPNFMDKIVPITGDIMELGIGLSEEDKNSMKNVSIIYHSAASVRFDDTLKYAVLMNTRGTREVLRFAECLKHLKVVMHVSTTYSNVHLSKVEEQIYPPLADWEKTVEICEKVNEDQLNLLSQRYMNFMPNTYVFSKNLAEHVSNDYKDKLPLVIFRPSIVLSAWEEPFGGYVDNFNGPMGILLASHIGISKTMYCDPKNVLDLTPVDICVKAMIIATWKRAHDPIGSELPVINAASANQIRCTVNQLLDIGINACCEEFAMGELNVTIPSGGVTLCKTWNLIRCFFYQLILAILIDLFLRLKKKKPRLMKVQRRMYEANKALAYFVTNNFDFQNANFLKLGSYLKCEDIRAFEFRHYFNSSVILYARKSLYGYRRYLMKLKDEDLEKDRKKFHKMKIATIFFRFLVSCSLFYLIFIKFDILNFIRQFK